MKKILSLIFIGSFILFGIGAGAVQNSNIRFISKTTIEKEQAKNITQTEYTHTVFVEVGTATWCPSCPESNEAWHSIYDMGNYEFEYTELVYDKNSGANARFNEFNPKWVPTSYFDGGEFVYPGTDMNVFYTNLNSSGSRIVPDLIADLDAAWFESGMIKIHYTVTNNEAKNYPGHLKIYVIEYESTYWNDYNGNPYHHAFLDFADNQSFDIPAAGSISDTVVWDGAAAGYPDITKDNIQVILAVFTNTSYASSSDPPRGNPFWAYYSDECVATNPRDDTPPETPFINGPTSGKIKVPQNYTINSVDPEADDIYYLIDWGDTSNNDWVGPFTSGSEAIISHTWTKKGNYIVTVKAKDTFGLESSSTTLEVSMPISYDIPSMQFWNKLVEKYPAIFVFLQQILLL